VKSFSISIALVIGAPVLAAGQLGGKPAAIESPYKTEHAWAIGETAADIAEIAAALRRVPPVFTVPADAKPWNPQLLVPFAREQFGPAPAKPAAEPPLANQYVPLSNLTATAIIRAGDAVSSALRQNLRSVRAHESAALVLGAFGLREAAGDLSDVRWTLNRMTAHLAIADALRPPDTPTSLDGQLARVVFLALANRTNSGLLSLEAVANRPDDAALAAWKNALRLRLTDDWRLVSTPAKGLRVEKLEYFRARRKGMYRRRAGQELSELLEPGAADFSRIVQTFEYLVEDGRQLVEPAVAAELFELSEVHRLAVGRDLPESLPADVMNTRAGRLMSGQGPRVIPWGAWAEYFQRHIGMYVGEIDQLYRSKLGLPTRADEIKALMDQGFGHLTLYPVASASRRKGKGTEADLTHINRAVDVGVRSPELVNYDFWEFLESGSRYEVVARAMPARTPWFAPPSAEVPFDAGRRSRDMIARMPLPELDALVSEASTDVQLAIHALRPRPGNQRLIPRIVAWFKARGAFDLDAVDAMADWARTLEDQIAWRRQGCALSITQCVSLASLLAYAGDEAGAVAEYERAFRDPAMDAVAVANSSSWLVAYYERSGQMTRAYDLAQRAAATWSARGLETLARLYERRARIDEAAAVYEQMAQRYKDSSPALAGFLYRQAIVGKRTQYLERWRQVERALFPNGLQPMPASMPQQPAAGVYVEKDSSMARRVRIQIGDIIVGVDGWRVDNEDQLTAVINFGELDARHTFTVWRGVLFTAELPARHGMTLDSYPLRGWIR
jgi:tetratricopeptide (TPR) repeat protein